MPSDRAPRCSVSPPLAGGARPSEIADSAARRARALRLLPLEALVKTGTVDHADWNYRPVLGAISRRRFQLVVSLLGCTRAHRLLEIGYGSGIFLPELSRHCEELYGVDIHPFGAAVSDSLSRAGVRAALHSASAAALPFPDAHFDVVVAISALEFVDDLDAACDELHRVLRPGAALIAVVPGHSRLVDIGLRLLTGQRARDDFENRRERVLPTLRRRFEVERDLSCPAHGGALLRLYTGIKLRRR